METIKLGSRGTAVKTLQRILNLYQDGIFGKLTEEAVKQYQQEHNLYADGIVGPKSWAKLLAEPTKPSASIPPTSTLNLKQTKRYVNKLIVHCTATKDGKDYTVNDIRRMHTTPVAQGGRGWSDIGYHYVIYRDGTIHEGRNIDTIGAHTSGYNSYSIGIVYVGGLAADGVTAKDTRTDKQAASLVKLLRELKKLYPAAAIHGHRDFAAKACPCFDARNEYKNL